MIKAVLAPGARIECRSAEWLVRSISRSSDGQQIVDVVGVSPFLQEKEAKFLVDVEMAAGGFKVLQPELTELVQDNSPQFRDSLLFIESHLRRTVPTDGTIAVGDRAAMDALPYQLEPAAKALAMPRQRLLIADAVGLGKTLECGILCSELIRRSRGKRILVVTTKSMLVQFQKEFWTRFSIPLVRLDSVGIQRIRQYISTNQNPFHYYDKTIVSIDTLKNDRDYRFYLDNASWDIIVIDECQNVAERAKGSQKSQRAKLADRLSTRSETLILLSATPHDGKPESFASLMNMLDPTAIANPSKYIKEDIKDLYVRRFRKDVLDDLRSNVKERDTKYVDCKANKVEERIFAQLKDLKLPDSDSNAKAGQLFKTTLAKSLLSSPMAALETVNNRLKSLQLSVSKSSADISALQELKPFLEAINKSDFSKYQHLIKLIKTEWEWNGKDSSDRIVIFTGRRETQRFLKENLANDLGLKDGAVVAIDGSMQDVLLNDVVEEFAQDKAKLRILIATEVASEGINLHYLCHRLVHFDIPWSLMTLQQRNGRIDRYGQKKQPKIRYLLTQSSSEGMGDADKIMRLLINKDQQAQQNIGDPSVFLRVFDTEKEEEEISKAFEERNYASLEKRMNNNEKVCQGKSNELNLFEEMFGIDSGEISTNSSDKKSAEFEVKTKAPFSLFPTIWNYVKGALEAESDRLNNKGEEFDFNIFDEQERLEISPPKDLERRYESYPKELRPTKGERLVLSTDSSTLQMALEKARRKDNIRPELEFLWDLHPIVDWLVDRGQIFFSRHCAPVLNIREGLDPGEVVMVLQGTIPNQKGNPVIQEWVAVRFLGTGLKVESVDPFVNVAKRLGLGRKKYSNSGGVIPNSLNQQRQVAVDAARRYLVEKQDEWRERMKPELEAQRERLKRLKGLHTNQLQMSFENDKRRKEIKNKDLIDKQKVIDRRFDDHESFMQNVMSIEPVPYLKVIAVLYREF